MEEQEDTYELAVMRAELLGSAPPDREEYEAARKARALESDQQDRQQAEQESIEAETLKEVEGQREELRGVAGGLEELTSILSITQNKINKFKTVCGSIKNLFKLRDEVEGGAGGSESGRATPVGDVNATEDHTREITKVAASGGAIGVQLESQVDKLDSLLIKTENAQMSMQSQNKQMRSFLR